MFCNSFICFASCPVKISLEATPVAKLLVQARRRVILSGCDFVGARGMLSFGSDVMNETTKTRRANGKRRAKPPGPLTDFRQLPDKEHYTAGELEMIRAGRAAMEALARAEQAEQEENNAATFRHQHLSELQSLSQ